MTQATPLPRPHGGHLTARGAPKKQYTRKEARQVVKQMRSRGAARGLSSYECTVCGWWHTGTKFEDK